MSQRVSFYELMVSQEADGSAFVQLKSNGPAGCRLVFDGRISLMSNSVALLQLELATGEMFLKEVHA